MSSPHLISSHRCFVEKDPFFLSPPKNCKRTQPPTITAKHQPTPFFRSPSSPSAANCKRIIETIFSISLQPPLFNQVLNPSAFNLISCLSPLSLSGQVTFRSCGQLHIRPALSQIYRQVSDTLGLPAVSVSVSVPFAALLQSIASSEELHLASSSWLSETFEPFSTPNINRFYHGLKSELTPSLSPPDRRHRRFPSHRL